MKSLRYSFYEDIASLAMFIIILSLFSGLTVAKNDDHHRPNSLSDRMPPPLSHSTPKRSRVLKKGNNKKKKSKNQKTNGTTSCGDLCALQAFYDGITNKEKLAGWFADGSTSPCNGSWIGITCDRDDAVTSINLSK